MGDRDFVRPASSKATLSAAEVMEMIETLYAPGVIEAPRGDISKENAERFSWIRGGT